MGFPVEVQVAEGLFFEFTTLYHL